MKKILVVACATFFTSISFISCKKENSEPVPKIVGYWVGKIGTNPDPPTQKCAFLFRNNGTVRVYFNNNSDTSTAKKAEGVYSLTDLTVKTTYNVLNYPVLQSTTASINSYFSYMEGTWGPNLNTVDGGKFFLQKQ
jgi:hypothetical protein